jgi:hypothetical protein
MFQEVFNTLVQSALANRHPNVVNFTELKPEPCSELTLDYSKPKKGDVVLKRKMGMRYDGKDGAVEYGICGRHIYYVMPRRWE